MLAGILSAHAIEYTPANVSASIALKVPGNEAVRYPLEFRKLRKERFDYQLTATESLPVLIYQKVEGGETNKRITLFITATENIYFNYGEQVKREHAMTTAFSICRASGIAATSVRPKKHPLSTPQTAARCAKIV